MQEEVLPNLRTHAHLYKSSGHVAAANLGFLTVSAAAQAAPSGCAFSSTLNKSKSQKVHLHFHVPVAPHAVTLTPIRRQVRQGSTVPQAERLPS